MKIGKLLEIIRQQSSNDSKILQNDNENMKKTVEELSDKCVKLERDKKDMERLIQTQSSLMKALNVRKTLHLVFAFICDIFYCIVL